MGYFISGFISASLLALIVAWCCTDNAKETHLTSDVPPVDSDAFAKTILDNLAKVQMVQFRLDCGVSYALAKQIVALEEAHHIVLIAVPTEDVEDMADLELQEKKLEEVKVKFASLGQLDLADDNTNGEEVA